MFQIEININSLAITLGRIIFHCYIYNNCLYVPVFKKPLDILNKTKNKNMMEDKEFRKYSDEQMFDVIELLVKTNYIFKTILTNLASNEELVIFITEIKDLYDIEKDLIVEVTYIGLEVINWLIDLNILEEFVRGNIPRIKIIKKYETCVYTPASSYKPPISTIECDTGYTFRKGFIDVTVDIKKNLVPNKYNVHLKTTPFFLKVLKETNLLPFSIDKKIFNDFILLLKEMLDLDMEDPRRLNYFSTMFVTDFKQYIEQFKIENGKDNLAGTIMEEFIAFAKNLDVYTCSKQDIFKEHMSLDAAFKKIRSYKFYIRGLLNDLNLYKHFEYFYIPKYITSTGRLHSAPYYLQLQGNKLALAFIDTYNPVQHPINENDFIKINDIIKKVIPKINNLPADFHSFNLESKKLFIEQIQSLCKPDTNLNEHKDHKNNFISEFQWLYKNCKKSENVFYLKSLLMALENNTFNKYEYNRNNLL